MNRSAANPGAPLVGYAKALAAQKEKTDELLKVTETIRGVDKDIRKELIDIGKTGSIEWLNPAFQAAAKQKAKEKKEHFTQLVGLVMPLYPIQKARRRAYRGVKELT